MIDKYVRKIAQVTKGGDAREESYYPALAALIEEFSEKTRHKKVHVTVLPRKTEAGNPDFRISDGKRTQIGYIEAKPPKARLDDIEDSEQLKRYLSTFPNLILTNFYEFRLYRDGKLIDQVLLARPFIPSKLKLVPPVEKAQEFSALLEKFLHHSLKETYTAEGLAKELATLTRFLRDSVIKEELREKQAAGKKTILSFYEAFQKHLISNLTPDDFADLYAQTITYGLFAARTRSNGKFNRKIAYDYIPRTIGILRDIFHFISFDPPPQLEASVDDIADVLAAADVHGILHKYFKEGKGSDPIYHFYETFLAAYNPQERERRGVYYTPEPVVSYIVRSLNIILKEKFGRSDGFADQSVTVLDPAGGTLTFLAEAARLAVDEYTEKYGNASRGKFIQDHILKHFYAFELMVAPYAAGHLKMGYLMEELGHKLEKDERFQFYLTNTLDMEGLAQTTIPGIASLSEESHLAEQVKKKEPILVILGNPPYSGISSNASEREVPVKKGEMYTKEYRIETIRQNGRVSYEVKRMPAYAKSIGKVKQKTWIGELIESYKIIDGEWFGERKHWLQDDYVKFIRFAQWKIEQVGEGVVGFITNHAYLDNPTFRGMRQSLLNAFDEIHILDLHGNSLKKEKCPDGSDDKNVFDIQQGVAIVLLIKLPKREQRCRVLHSERWGQREAKYQFLQSSDFRETKSKELLPSSPFYFLLPKNDSGLANWNGYVAVTDVFPINVTGIVTARDAFVIDFEKAALRKRIEMFMDLNLDDDFVQASFQLSENYMWRVHEARRQLAKVPEWEERFAQILYRPFDIRHTYFHPSVIWRTRADVMRHMLQENLALICPRQHKEQSGAFVTKHLAGHKTVSAFDINNVFPVYLYPDTDKQDLFSSHSANRQPNIAPGLIAALKSAFGKPPTPEEIFYYIYAILYANAYRQKYAEFLKTDFPRVPFTTDSALFRKLAEAGKELVALHLLESRKLAKPIAKCEGEGKLQVVKITYDPKRKRVHINPGTWFTGVSPELFEYHVGGYQVAQKWLKDRKGRTLSSEEVSSYCKILTALSETIRIQQSLDPLFEEVEKNLVEVKL